MPETPAEEKALRYIRGQLHARLCGKVPGYEHLDLFDQHSAAARSMFELLTRHPSEVRPRPEVTAGGDIRTIDITPSWTVVIDLAVPTGPAWLRAEARKAGELADVLADLVETGYVRQSDIRAARERISRA